MEEAKNAFNQNMMSGGVLTEGPKAFGEEYHKRWLVSEYEAGDVVIHSSYAVSLPIRFKRRELTVTDPCLDHQSCRRWSYPSWY
jgi:hypothetical protein